MYFSSFCNWNHVSKSHREGSDRGRTYIFPDNRAETRTPEYALTRDLIHEESLATEHGFADALALVLGDDALGTGEERVFADAPLLGASELDDGDVADGRGREE